MNVFLSEGAEARELLGQVGADQQVPDDSCRGLVVECLECHAPSLLTSSIRKCSMSGAQISGSLLI